MKVPITPHHLEYRYYAPPPTIIALDSFSPRHHHNDLEDSEPQSAIIMTQKTSKLIPGGANKRTIGRPKFNPSMH